MEIRSHRGGLRLDGADLDGLKRISESRSIVKQIVLNIADGRSRFHGFAGAVDFGMGCWEYSLRYLEDEFAPAEVEEVLGALSTNPYWLNHLQIEYYLFLREEMGCDFLSESMVSARKQAKETGRIFTFRGVKGRLNKRALFVPLDIKDEDYDLQDLDFDDVFERFLDEDSNCN